MQVVFALFKAWKSLQEPSCSTATLFFIILLNKCINNVPRKFATSLHPNACELATENTDRWAMTDYDTCRSLVDPFAEDAVKISVEQVLSQNTDIIIISIFVIFMACVTSPCDVAGCLSCSSILRDLQLVLSPRINSHNVRRFKYQTTFYPAYFMCALGCRSKICIGSAVSCLQRSSYTIFTLCLVNVIFCKIASLLPRFASDEFLNSWIWNYLSGWFSPQSVCIDLIPKFECVFPNFSYPHFTTMSPTNWRWSRP